ncbi:MAG: carboxypeptidase regulatory-like domain-containing protein [Cyanobacteria bacterium REEB65]|nr:carboxypeptidase regulatory-like domain-containing protein [Cyanobacteria bacterium REEB65]
MGRQKLGRVANLALAVGLLATGCGQVPSVAIPAGTYGNGGSTVTPIQNQPTGTVTGQVVDARTGLGIPDVTVEVAGVSPPVQTQTDGDGNYILNNVPAERIKITLQKQGYTYPAGAGDTIVQVLPGNTITAPNIQLSQEADAQPNAFVLSIPNLNHPRAIAIGPDSSGTSQALYAINQENYSLLGSLQTPFLIWGVRKFNLAGGLEDKFADNAVMHALQNPMGLCVDKGGDVYIADPGANAIQVYSSFGAYIQPASANVDFAGVNDPYDITVMRTGQFAVSSAGNNEVMLFDASMGPAHDASGNPLQPIGGFDGIKGVTVDADDNLYVVDDAAPAGGVIKKESPQGQVLLQFGFRGGTGAGYFVSPTAIAVDNRNGDIYVVDSGNNRVQRFNRDGAFMSEFGGMGGGNGQFNEPTGVAVDSDGYVYVSDTNNNRIEKFAPSQILPPSIGQ